MYRFLLRLYPRAFRERFEAEMIAMVEAQAAAVDRSLRARLAFWRGVLADLTRSVLRERGIGRSAVTGVGRANLADDFRQAWRMVRRAPLLSAFVILLMALSIGSTTAVFSIVHAVLLRPLPFPKPDRLVMVWERQGPEDPRNMVGAHEFPEWERRSRSFERLAAISFDREYNLTGAGEPLKLVTPRVTSAFFQVLGIQPEAGRVFAAEEDEPGHGDVVILSDRLWRSRFGADPAIVGRAISLSGVPYTVTGVMPPEFDFPPGAAGASPDAWVPIAEPIQLYRGRHYLWVVARLRDGVTIAGAQAEMDGIAAAIANELPQFSRGHGVNVQPLHGEIVQSVSRTLLLLFAGVGLVLLIGCCNVANLLLARAASRQQEIAVRVALGAGRLRIGRQLLAEGGLLACTGGAAGVLLATWLTALARATAPGEVPRLQQAQIDSTTLIFAAALSVLTAMAFGLVPLAQVARVQVADRLKHGAKGVARLGRQPLRRTLIIVEVMLTMVVATASGLLVQSFLRVSRVDSGFQAGGVVAADVALPSTRYATATAQRTFFDAAMARVQASQAVTSVGATSMVPQGLGRGSIAIQIEGRRAARPGDEPSAAYRVVSDDYFKVLRVAFIEGRPFTAADTRVAVPIIRWFPEQRQPERFDDPQPAPVAIVNESMARRFWPGESPLGRRFTVLFSPPITTVGVVKDTRDESPWEDAGPEFYLSHRQEPQNRMTLLVRGADTIAGLPPLVRSAIWSIDRDLPVANLRPLAEIVDGNVALYRAMVVLMGGFALSAIVLMALGIYAVVSYTTAQRTYEIGVRLALGARQTDIRRLVLVSGAGTVLVGIIAGAAGAYALARYAGSLLYEIRPADPATYVFLGAVVLVIAAAAAWAPARRAQRVDPVSVLRNE
jgi:putative ABC transport system permease protein